MQKEESRVAFAELDLGNAVAVHQGKFLGVGLDAVWGGHNSSQKAEQRVLFSQMIIPGPSCEEVEHAKGDL